MKKLLFVLTLVKFPFFLINTALVFIILLPFALYSMVIDIFVEGYWENEWGSMIDYLSEKNVIPKFF